MSHIDKRIVSFYELPSNQELAIIKEIDKHNTSTIVNETSLQAPEYVEEYITEAFLKVSNIDITMMAEVINSGYNLDEINDIKAETIKDLDHYSPQGVLSMMMMKIDSLANNDINDKITSASEDIYQYVDKPLPEDESQRLFDNVMEGNPLGFKPLVEHNGYSIPAKDVLSVMNLQVFSELRLKAICSEYLGSVGGEQLVYTNSPTKSVLGAMINQFDNYKGGHIIVGVETLEGITTIAAPLTLIEDDRAILVNDSNAVGIVEFPFLNSATVAVIITNTHEGNNDMKLWLWDAGDTFAAGETDNQLLDGDTWAEVSEIIRGVKATQSFDINAIEIFKNSIPAL